MKITNISSVFKFQISFLCFFFAFHFSYDKHYYYLVTRFVIYCKQKLYILFAKISTINGIHNNSNKANTSQFKNEKKKKITLLDRFLLFIISFFFYYYFRFKYLTDTIDTYSLILFSILFYCQFLLNRKM